MGRIIGLVLTVLAIYFAVNYVTGIRSAGEGEERLERLLPE